jgi:hypothetical protein
LWAEADGSGRRNKTALFRTAGADAVAAFAVSEAPGFLSLFCGLSLSFARKKEKPPSGLKLTAAVQEKGWLLLTQQTTQVELKEKPPSGLKLAAAAREQVSRCRRGKAGNVPFAGNRSPLRPTQFVSRHIISAAQYPAKKRTDD